MSRLVSSPQAVLGFASSSHSFQEKTEPARSALGRIKGGCQRLGEALSVASVRLEARINTELLAIFLVSYPTGTLFLVHIALHGGQLVREPEAKTATTYLRKGKCAVKTPTVLLIIEDSFDLILYATSLRNKGYKTLLGRSLSEGIKFLGTEDVSLVIVSQGTPAFEGRQVLERSLRLCPKVPVLVVARALDTHCYLDAMDLGATDYLERPEPEDLTWVVDTQMHRAEAATTK